MGDYRAPCDCGGDDLECEDCGGFGDVVRGLQEALRELLKQANRVAEDAGEWRWKDHACAECEGTTPKPGFRCVRHAAAHLLRVAATAPGAAAHQDALREALALFADRGNWNGYRWAGEDERHPVQIAESALNPEAS